jgi:hypothetical protein
VVRVGENSSVSVDVIAGFDVLSINSVPNQTHSSFILCYTHTLRSMNTVCTILHYNKLKNKKCHYYRIGFHWNRPHTHTLLFIFSRMYSENIGFHSQGERRLTSVYTYMHEPFFWLEIDAKGKKIVLGLFLFWLLFLF